MQNHRSRKSRSHNTFRNTTTAPTWVGVPEHREHRETKGTADGPRGWQVVKVTSGALAAAVVSAFVARRNWLPARFVSGAVAVVGAVLAAGSRSSALRGVGSGAMAWAAGELGVALVNGLVRRGPLAQQVADAVQPVEPTPSGGLPPGALEAAFARARAKVAMHFSRPRPREPDREQDSDGATNRDCGATLNRQLHVEGDVGPTADERIVRPDPRSADPRAGDGALRALGSTSECGPAAFVSSNRRVGIGHGSMIADAAALPPTWRSLLGANTCAPVVSSCAAVQATWSELADASASLADQCSAQGSLEPPTWPVTARSSGRARGGSVDADTASFQLSLDRTIRTPGASLVPP
jgi:hypothetical protein